MDNLHWDNFRYIGFINRTRLGFDIDARNLWMDILSDNPSCGEWHLARKLVVVEERKPSPVAGYTPGGSLGYTIMCRNFLALHSTHLGTWNTG
jgi:hypothetical protein